MSWREMVQGGFPPPHETEPPELRRDILDELSDHLACSVQRELRHSDDPATAERAVLAHFGDPVRLARQLWFDWMKEKIMKDRILLSGVGLMVIACIAMAVFAWMALEQNRRLNVTMLARLEALATRPAAETPPDWSEATIRLVENGSGRPIAGESVSLRGKAFDDDEVDLYATSDENGTATFGPVRPGRYEIAILVRNRFAFGSPQSAARQLTLYAGQRLERTIVCPSLPSDASISFNVDWGGEEPVLDTLVRARFYNAVEPIQLDGVPWYDRGRSVWLNSDGEVLDEFTIAHTVDLPDGDTMTMRSFPETAATVQWPAITYRLTKLYVYCPVDGSDDRVATKWKEYARHTWRAPTSPPPVFEPSPGQTNRWTISIPEEVRAEVRRRMPDDGG